MNFGSETCSDRPGDGAGFGTENETTISLWDTLFPSSKIDAFRPRECR